MADQLVDNAKISGSLPSGGKFVRDEQTYEFEALDDLVVGRQTGSTEWRTVRGELGRQRATAEQNAPEPQQGLVGAPLPQLVEAADDATALQSISQVAGKSRDAEAQKAVLPDGEDESSVPTAVPAASNSGARSANSEGREGSNADKDEFTRRMQAEFAELMASGEHRPNAAAALALARVTGNS